MKKLKVLEIIGDATLAGAPRHLLSILENIDYKKFTIFVISPPGPLAAEVRSLKKNIDLEIVPMNSRIDIGAIREIRSNIKHLKPDIIHIHGTRAGLLARVASIGLDSPIIYTEHLWTKQYRLRNPFLHGLQIFGLWFLDMFTTANIAVSQAVKDFMVDNQISRYEKIVVIYNAIELPRTKAKIFSDKKEILLGTVGSLNYQKGIQFLIRAMPRILKEFPNVKLEIVGEGTYKKVLQSEVDSLKLKNKVIFAGFVKNIYERIEKFDVYIQPSISESFGLAIIQAMGMGIPVVATTTGGIPEVVTTGKSGFLVPASSPKALAQGVLELLRDPEMAKKMGEIAREDVKIKFNLKDMIEKTETLYEAVAESSA